MLSITVELEQSEYRYTGEVCENHPRILTNPTRNLRYNRSSIKDPHTQALWTIPKKDASNRTCLQARALGFKASSGLGVRGFAVQGFKPLCSIINHALIALARNLNPKPKVRHLTPKILPKTIVLYKPL